ncbi:hypothetical protein OF83DRAFT_148158 [Amylostereum chailletii]|nr:hypothetical protein OF83DRAFT_148158 [Amylostereum chailletii]
MINVQVCAPQNVRVRVLSRCREQVESSLFRIHRYFLEKNSSDFRQAISGEGSDTMGKNSEEQLRLILDNTTALEFEVLLKYFYESMDYGFRLTMPQWVALLAISTRYKFNNIKPRAIKEVYVLQKPSFDPITQLELAERHGVKCHFLIPALRTLVTRTDCLTKAEISRLSSERVAYIMQARESYNGSGVFTTTRTAIERNDCPLFEVWLRETRFLWRV